MSLLNNALALWVVGNASDMFNAEALAERLEVFSSVSWAIVGFDYFMFAYNWEALKDMGNDILWVLSCMEGGKDETTEGIKSNMNLLKFSKFIEMGNIHLPNFTWDQSTWVNPNVRDWEWDRTRERQ